MRALVLEHHLQFRTDYPVPEPKAGEALIRVTQAGICTTDLEIVKGYMQFTGILGHEFVGIVEQAGDRPDLLGCKVAGEIKRCLSSMRNLSGWTSNPLSLSHSSWNQRPKWSFCRLPVPSLSQSTSPSPLSHR